MEKQIRTNYVPTTVSLKVILKPNKNNTPRTTNIALVCYNAKKPDTCYIKRIESITSASSFYFPMPITPEYLNIRVWEYGKSDSEKISKENFTIDLKIGSVKRTDFWANEKLLEFITFASFICENLSILPIGDHKSKNGTYTIGVYDVIKDATTGATQSTPMRISAENGRIEIAKKPLLGRTVPMRMAVLLHEYSHYYVNANMANEIEADLNSLNIYLGYGFPKYDAKMAWLHVFDKAWNKGNQERYGIIENFINIFDKKENGYINK